MKQIFLLLTALLAIALQSVAQTTQVATLSHDGTITTFYSGSALKDAHAVAVDGDVITLSSGTFASTDIKKNITVRGAGMLLDSEPTVLSGLISIDCPDSESHYLTLEGFYHNGTCNLNGGKNVRLVKCNFKELLVNGSYFYIQAAINCKIDRLRMKANYSKSAFINCYINSDFSERWNTPESMSFENCVWNFGTYDMIDVPGMTLKNCLLIGGSESTDQSFSDKILATYTYYVGKSANPFIKCASSNCMKLDVEDPKELFVNEDFTLNDAFKEICVGEDGTEAGIHGGLLPFDPTPTNPQITRFNVASKTTADGKLSVDIEIKGN